MSATASVPSDSGARHGNGVTATSVSQARSIVQEIARRADTVDEAFSFADLDGDAENLTNQLVRLRDDIRQIGMFADMAAKKLGGLQMRDPEQWMFPPTYGETTALSCAQANSG